MVLPLSLLYQLAVVQLVVVAVVVVAAEDC